MRLLESVQLLTYPAAMACISRVRPALGTFVGFEAHAPTTAQALGAIDAAAAVIARLEALLHPTRPGSDLLTIVNGDVGAPTRVHPWTFALLTLCQTLHRVSSGVFDPCLPDAAGRMGDVELRAPDSVITHAPVMIDLGGIAKGYAVDRAIEAMHHAGCVSALVNAGGDVRASGERSFAISCRQASGQSRDLQLRNTALAISRRNSDTAPTEHQGYYLRVTPAPVTAAESAAIFAPSAALADALTKCALLCSDEHCDDILRHFGASRLIKSESC